MNQAINLLSLQLDSETGLPPEKQELDENVKRLETVQRLAREAHGLLKEAVKATRFQCSCELPERIADFAERSLADIASVRAYETLVQEIREHVAADRWDAAVNRLRDYLAHDDDQYADPLALRLLAFLEIGEEAHQVCTSGANDRTRWARLRRLEQERGFSHPLLLKHSQYLQQLEARLVGPELLRLRRMVSSAERLCSQRTSGKVSRSLPQILTTPLLAAPEEVEKLEAFLKGSDELRPLVETPQEGDRSPRKRRAPGAVRKWVKKIREAAGPNWTALLADMGDVKEVFRHAKDSRDNLDTVVLHNLAVAVFSGLQQRETEKQKHDEESLRVALGACALLAADQRHLDSVIDKFRKSFPVTAPDSVARAREQIRDELRTLFENSGIRWGIASDPHCWACRWESEWYATMKLTLAQTSTDAPYRLGPALVAFFGKEEGLRPMVQGNPELRRWFGPCALGLIVSHRDEFEQALEWFDQTEARARQLARREPGYSALPDPPLALERDAILSRCTVRLRILSRCQISSDASEQQAEQVKTTLCENCEKVLEDLERLGEAGPDQAMSLGSTVKGVFKTMERQLDNPDVELQRRATIADGRIRWECVDAAVALVEKRIHSLESTGQRAQREQNDRQKLLSSLRYCADLWRRKRSDVLVSYLILRSNHWYACASGSSRSHQQLRDMLEDMERLAKEAVRDHPRSPHAHLAEEEIHMLRCHFDKTLGPETDRIRARLEHLKQLAVGFGWPDPAHARLNELQEMLDLANTLKSHGEWLRQMQSRGMTEG